MTKRNARGYANRKQRSIGGLTISPAQLQTIRHPGKHMIISAADALSSITAPHPTKRRAKQQPKRKAGQDSSQSDG